MHTHRGFDSVVRVSLSSSESHRKRIAGLNPSILHTSTCEIKKGFFFFKSVCMSGVHVCASEGGCQVEPTDPYLPSSSCSPLFSSFLPPSLSRQDKVGRQQSLWEQSQKHTATCILRAAREGRRRHRETGGDWGIRRLG